MNLVILFPSITLKTLQWASIKHLWTSIPTHFFHTLLHSGRTTFLKPFCMRLHHIFWIICTFPFAQPTTAEFPFDAMFTAVISVLLTVKVPSTWVDLTFWSFTTPSCRLYASKSLVVFLKSDSLLTTLKPENLPGIWTVWSVEPSLSMIWMTASSKTEKTAFEPLLLCMPLLIISASETFFRHWTKVTRCSQQTLSWRLIEGCNVNWTFQFTWLLRSHTCNSAGPFIHSWLLLCLGTLITTSLPQVFDMAASVICLQGEKAKVQNYCWIQRVLSRRDSHVKETEAPSSKIPTDPVSFVGVTWFFSPLRDTN